MSWQRATKPEQKSERVDTILQAASVLFESHDFNSIAMRMIAGQAGLGKASLYHYFQTKEEVFLALYQKDVYDWAADIEQRLGRLRRPTVQRVAAVFASAIDSHQRFGRLSALLSEVLERNLAQETIVQFKQSLFQPLEQVAIAIKTALPQMSRDQSIQFVFQHHVILAGMWPLTHPSPELAAVVDRPEFKVFKIEINPLFEHTLRDLLTGIIA